MAKVTAPLLSFGASGTIAGIQTYSRWRGIPYARQRVIPANPNSPDQQLTRNSFKWLNGFWKLMSADGQAPWQAFAAGQPLTGRNALISKNNSALREAANNEALIMSPGALGGLPVPAATATGSAGTVTFAMTAPQLPIGWTIVGGTGMVVKQQDPQSDANYQSWTNVDNATPFAPVITALAAGTYVWGVWFKFLKPNGTFAYSPSTTGTVVVT